MDGCFAYIVRRFSPASIKQPETGAHRHVRVLGKPAITGPEGDVIAQILCFFAFCFAWVVWPVFAGVFVAQANVLLALVPFLTLLLVGSLSAIALNPS